MSVCLAFSTVQNVSLVNAKTAGAGVVGALVGTTPGNSSSIINSSATGTVTATSNEVGGLVGQNSFGDSIVNSWANVTVNGGNGTNNIYSFFVGGLAGYNGGSITSSWASGSVTGFEYIGGLVGLNYVGATITGSNASGAVTAPFIAGEFSNTGGLVGENDGSINTSHATGNVNGPLTGDGYAMSRLIFGGSVGNNTARLRVRIRQA